LNLPVGDLLRLTQWLSPAFPVSGYAYSHGLETAMAEGRVADAATAGAWIACVLEYGGGALDAWAIRAVLRGEAADDVSDLLRARAGCAERWAETRDMGAAFGAAAVATGLAEMRDHPLPVALALRARGIAAEAVCALHLHAFAAQLVSAAVRMIPLGQGDGQAVTARLHPAIVRLAADPHETPPGSAAFLAELDAMRHETLQPRMFRT